MKKFTGIVIIMALVLMQNVDQTEGFGEFSDRIMINKYISHTNNCSIAGVERFDSQPK